MPSFQQSIGGPPYPGQQVNTSPHHLSNSGVAGQREGAVATGVHLTKKTLPIFQDSERTGKSLKQSGSRWQRGHTRTRQP